MTTYKAANNGPDRQITVTELTLGELEPGYILVKVHSAAVNPGDWKSLAFQPVGSIGGADYAGTVVDAGNSPRFKAGDRVAGYIIGNSHPTRGTYAQYTQIEEKFAMKIPDALSFDDASTLGVPFFTAMQLLYIRLGLPEPEKSGSEKIPLLIWSGATAVGQYAIQLAKLSNLTVIVTASPENHSYLKTLGADHLLDYRSPDVVDKILELTDNDLKYAIDTVSLPESFEKVNKTIGKNGGKIVTVGPLQKIRPDVEVEMCILFTNFGREYRRGPLVVPAQPEHLLFQERWQNQVLEYATSGKIKPNRYEVRGGLEALPQIHKDLKENKNKGSRYIVHP